MKTILTLFFLAALTTAATAAPLSELPVSVTGYFNGELCGSFDETVVNHHAVVKTKRGLQSAVSIFPAAKITATESRTLQCETTVELSYPKGYRFYVFSPKISGLIIDRSGFSLDTELDIRAGVGQYQRYHHVAKSGPSGSADFDVAFGEPFRGELRSDCSGSAELVITNSATIRYTDLREPGEIDDIGMAFIDWTELGLDWERCAPGEL